MAIELGMADNPYYVTKDGVFRNVITDIQPLPVEAKPDDT
jgi:hypothetical protein